MKLEILKLKIKAIPVRYRLTWIAVNFLPLRAKQVTSLTVKGLGDHLKALRRKVTDPARIDLLSLVLGLFNSEKEDMNPASFLVSSRKGGGNKPIHRETLRHILKSFPPNAKGEGGTIKDFRKRVLRSWTKKISEISESLVDWKNLFQEIQRSDLDLLLV